MAQANPGLMLLGDLCLAGRVEEVACSCNGYDPFAGLAGTLEANDVLVANLECALSHRGTPREKYAVLRAAPEAARVLQRLDVAVLANNHVTDYGREAAEDTQAVLSSLGIRTVGWGRNLDEALAPAVVERGGRRIGVLAFSCLSTNGRNFASRTTAGVAPLSVQLVKAAILSARALCDLVAVYVHWGCENVHSPVRDQIRLGRRMIDWGADVVAGCHSHVVQTYELYGGKPVFHGLGNFLFADVPWSEPDADGRPRSGVKRQIEANRQSLGVLLDCPSSGPSLRQILALMFGEDLVPQPVAESSFTVDLASLNRRLERYARIDRIRLLGEEDIVYKTLVRHAAVSHRYESPPFSEESLLHVWGTVARLRLRSALGRLGRGLGLAGRTKPGPR